MNHKRMQKPALLAAALTVGMMIALFAAASVSFAEADPSSELPETPDVDIQAQDELQDMIPEEVEPEPEEVWEIGRITLSKQSCVYIGKAIKPAVTVKGTDGRTLKEGTDYTLIYENNVKIGTAAVTIVGSSTYWGCQTITFKIVPTAPKLTSVKGAKKALEIKWSGKPAQATGYEILCSTSSKFSKNNKKVRVKGSKAKSKTIKKLKRHKTYYVKVRTYKTVSGKTYYSAWSKVRKAKTK